MKGTTIVLTHSKLQVNATLLTKWLGNTFLHVQLFSNWWPQRKHTPTEQVIWHGISTTMVCSNKYSKSSKPVKDTENYIYSQVICSIPASHPSYQGIQINDHWNIQSKQTAILWPIHLYPLNFKIISKIWLGNWQFFYRFPFSILHILFFSLVWQVKRTLHSNLQWWSKPTG